MKLTAKTIADFIKSPARQSVGVLIYGPDSGLVRERFLQVTRAVLGSSPDPFAQVELSDEQLKSDPALLADAWGAISLLGGAQVISVRNASDRLAKAIEQILTTSSSHYLIICAEELGPRSALRQLFETNPKLAALPCYKDEAADIGSLIREHLNAAGIRLTPEASQYVLAQLGNDRGVTQSELDKIVLYMGDEKELSLETAQALVGHNRDIGFDAIALAVVDRQPSTVDNLLKQAFRENMQPIAILRSVLRHLEKLYAIRAEADTGLSIDQIISSIRPSIFFRLVPQLRAQAQRYSCTQLAQMIGVINEAEATCKSGTIDSQLATSRACLRLAAAGTRPTTAAA